MEYSAMRKSWETMISKIEKYFPKSRINPDSWEILIGEKNKWAFDLLNKIWCNASMGLEWADPFHPAFAIGRNRGYKFVDLDEKKQYTITSKVYLHNVIKVHFYIENY